MPSERCNKCKEGSTPPGDSWCIGCSALELGQSVLRQRWVHVGLRKAAEETLLSSARVVKGLCNLDKGLAQEAQEVAHREYIPSPGQAGHGPGAPDVIADHHLRGHLRHQGYLLHAENRDAEVPLL